MLGTVDECKAPRRLAFFLVPRGAAVVVPSATYSIHITTCLLVIYPYPIEDSPEGTKGPKAD